MSNWPISQEGDGTLLSTELLGFSPQTRVLIVNADDFGIDESVNTAVVRALDAGIASSCSLMVRARARSRRWRFSKGDPTSASAST